jgi:hypothetical protein
MWSHVTLATAVQTTIEQEVEFFGRYSHLEYTAEHAYGYDLQLWRDGKSIVGLWSRTNGPPADFPAVLVTDLSWVESTGVLRFTAKWCNEDESFEGSLQKGRLVATITSRRVSERTESATVVLTKQNDDWGTLPRAEWRALIDKILEARTPKC